MQNTRTGAGARLQTGTVTDACSTCEPPPKDRCRELRDKMHKAMYGRKGEGSDAKGIFQRQAEQISGQYGPGMQRMSTGLSPDKMQRVIRMTEPWVTHQTAIREQQVQIKELQRQFNKLGCGGNPDLKLNNKDVDRVLEQNFNPKPSDWTGP